MEKFQNPKKLKKINTQQNNTLVNKLNKFEKDKKSLSKKSLNKKIIKKTKK